MNLNENEIMKDEIISNENYVIDSEGISICNERILYKDIFLVEFKESNEVAIEFSDSDGEDEEKSLHLLEEEKEKHSKFLQEKLRAMNFEGITKKRSYWDCIKPWCQALVAIFFLYFITEMFDSGTRIRRVPIIVVPIIYITSFIGNEKLPYIFVIVLILGIIFSTRSFKKGEIRTKFKKK